MRSRRAATATVLVLVVSGCGADAAGTSTINPAATVGSVITSSAAASATAPTAPGPAVTTLTVTALTTEPATTQPPAGPPSAPPPTTQTTDLSGEVYGFVTAVDPVRSELTLDKIDWFTGDAARQACAEDGVTNTDNNWCTGYYWRNRNPVLRTVSVSPGAAITVLDGAASVPGTLDQVARRIAQASSTYRLLVEDGAVTQLHEMYAP